MLLQTFLWQRTGQNQLSEYAGLTERHMMKINHTQISINSDVFGDDALLREKLSPLFAGIQKFNKKKKLEWKGVRAIAGNCERWKTLCKPSTLTGRRHSTKCIEVKCFLFTEQLNFSVTLTYTRRHYTFFSPYYPSINFNIILLLRRKPLQLLSHLQAKGLKCIGFNFAYTCCMPFLSHRP